MPFPIEHDLLFDDTDFATPATYVNAAGVSKDVDVIMDSLAAASTIGEIEVDNNSTVAIGRAVDFADFSRGAKLIEHALTENDEGTGYITDHLGQPIVAVNINTWYIINKQLDAAGLCLLVLSKDPVQ